MGDALFCLVVMGIGLVAIRLSRRGQKLQCFRLCTDCRLGYICDTHRLHS
jgi:hypothetical protein